MAEGLRVGTFEFVEAGRGRKSWMDSVRDGGHSFSEVDGDGYSFVTAIVRSGFWSYLFYGDVFKLWGVMSEYRFARLLFVLSQIGWFLVGAFFVLVATVMRVDHLYDGVFGPVLELAALWAWFFPFVFTLFVYPAYLVGCAWVCRYWLYSRVMVDVGGEVHGVCNVPKKRLDGRFAGVTAGGEHLLRLDYESSGVDMDANGVAIVYERQILGWFPVPATRSLSDWRRDFVTMDVHRMYAKALGLVRGTRDGDEWAFTKKMVVALWLGGIGLLLLLLDVVFNTG